MNELFNIKLQYFPSKVWEVEPLGEITLKKFILSHKNPSKKIQKVFADIEEAAASGNLKRKDELKQSSLFYFTPSIMMDGKGRSYSNIVYFNPLMVVEFDKIDHAEELKVYLFKKLKSCVCAYLSPSRRGCKFLIKIPQVQTVEEYKEYFCGLANFLEELEGFDGANYNPALPLFLSYDENILYRANPKTWRTKGYKKNAFKHSDITDEELPSQITPEDTWHVKNIVRNFMRKIDDNGHPQVVSISTTLGGFVGAGYIKNSDAEELIFDLIEENDYLQKGVQGYKKTAREMIQRGLKNPLLLDKDK